MDLYKLGQLFGFLALTCLVLQPVLSSRFKFLDRLFGLDKIMRLHALNGKLLFLFVFLHPTLMYGPMFLEGTSLLTLISYYTVYHWLGIGAFLLIIFTLVITLWQAKFVKNYEHWKFLHKVGYVIIILGFLHSFYLGSDIAEREKAYYFWILLLIIASVAIFHRYVIRNIVLSQSKWVVTKIVQETRDVRSIYLKPKNGKVFDYKPGQFAFVRFYSPQVSSEEHHFTISTAPGTLPGGIPGGTISFTIKELGDYTSTLGALKIGDRARVEGPFGSFTNEGMTGPFVFIAGGIGITPIISMIRAQNTQHTANDAQKRAQEALLIYAAKTESDLVFRNELDELAKKQRDFNVAYKIGEHIDDILLKKHIKDFGNTKFFVCGPEGFMKSVEKLLVENGASKELIFTEKFSLK